MKLFNRINRAYLVLYIFIIHRSWSLLLVTGRLPMKTDFSKLYKTRKLSWTTMIVMAGRISGAQEIILNGDIRQLPYIDRENEFEMLYRRPPQILINQNPLRTHRSLINVAYALRDISVSAYNRLRKQSGSYLWRTSRWHQY